MTDLEINRALALAIGWREEHLLPTPLGLCVVLDDTGSMRQSKSFDHTDPAVIWPIAERFNCFPSFDRLYGWNATEPGQYLRTVLADTGAKAVALAVIRAGGER